MVRKIVLFTFTLFFAFVSNSLAHTGLKDSSPKNGETVKTGLQAIRMSFQTKVELNSTFELKNSNGESIPLENITLNEKQMAGNLSRPLENGIYQVLWKIIGADGHPIEGEFSFNVDVPAAESPAEEQKEAERTAEKETEQGAEKDTTKEPATSNAEEEMEQNKLPSFVIPGILGLLIVLFVGSFLWIMRRNK